MALSFLSLLFFSNVFSQDSPACSWTDPTTKTLFDLSKLTLSEGFYTSHAGVWDWELNVCDVVPTQTCAEKQGILCNYDEGAYISAWATWGNPDLGLELYPTWSLINPANASVGVQLNFTNGTPFCQDGAKRTNRSSLMKFICNPKRTEATNFTIFQDGNCIWIVEFETAYGCPIVHEAPAGKKPLSAGSVILIMLTIAIPLYIVIGCIYKSRKDGTHGADSCPNVEFWRDLPNLVRDGIRFTLRGCRKGSPNEYQDL